ncbi:MAG: hypothetical protein ACIAQZ_10310 [Sedimentisphaeraceae bacterium JB056]
MQNELSDNDLRLEISRLEKKIVQQEHIHAKRIEQMQVILDKCETERDILVTRLEQAPESRLQENMVDVMGQDLQELYKENLLLKHRIKELTQE